MYDSPNSLQDACVNFICKNLDAVCDTTQIMECDPPHHTQVEETAPRMSFKESDIYFHSSISEKLLGALSDSGQLSDLTMTLFDSKKSRLNHVRLQNAEKLTTRGLRVLRGHKISYLEATGLKVTVNDLIGCLGEWTLENLRSLDVSRSTFVDDLSRYCVVVSLSKLHNLNTLNVSNTEFNRHGLDIVAEDLPHLESLDISCTRVDDISPLRKCKNRLKCLRMYNLKISYGIIPIILELHRLLVLDISDDKDSHPFETHHFEHSRVTSLLRSVNGLPELVALDISGKEDVTVKDLRMFIEHHPRLIFLGLVNCDASQDSSFIFNDYSSFYRTLSVAGTSCEEQILEALRHYTKRPLYIQKCLYNLFRLTPTFDQTRVDVIELILPGMELHPQQFGVQMAATACLYNLTKGDLAQKIHPSLLKKVVELTLTAMETFPNHYQLQKNTLLTLCSDRILQDVSFDKYRCARLVMSCLCAFDDASMNRMSVAICSILAAKISTSETTLLGAQPQYMKKLLAIVNNKLEAKTVDITIKFTLSALWNLTDESPKTCSVFLEEGGMDLFLKVLDTFIDENTVETKVLGLMNNIAEVPDLRQKLMIPQFICALRKLLHSTHIDVSYFAAGIVAHLASDGPEAWATVDVTREELLEELGNVVDKWETPEGEMVAYRSFHPFFPLLCCPDAYQVQLWAVWAIQHVCSKNPKRYCPMLIEEGGVAIINRLCLDTAVHDSVRAISHGILDILITLKADNDLWKLIEKDNL